MWKRLDFINFIDGLENIGMLHANFSENVGYMIFL